MVNSFITSTVTELFVTIIDSDDKIRPGRQTQTQDFQAKNRQQLDNENLSQKNGRKSNDVRDERGLNEPWEWYDKCQIRERNKGLHGHQVFKSPDPDCMSCIRFPITVYCF